MSLSLAGLQALPLSQIKSGHIYMELSMYAYLIIYEASYLTSFKFFLFRVKLKRTNSYLVSHSYISLLVLVVFSRLSYVHFVFSTAFLFTVLFSTICWLIATFVTKPTNSETLDQFYRKVRPEGWWKPFHDADKSYKSQMLSVGVCWLSAIVMVYACLFLIGDLIFANYQKAAIETIIVLLSYLILRFQMKRTRIFDI